jgi:transposase
VPITNLPPLRRYLDDKQWSVVGRAIKQAGGQINEGNRLHVDAMLDLMRSKLPWRDLDPRYGPWPNVHAKYVRWYETGVLLNVTKALFDTGMTEDWRPVFTEISHGISARPGPQIRPLMTQIVVELRRHRDAPGKKKATAAPKLPQPVGTTHRDKVKAYAAKIKEAVKARKGATLKRLTDADWSYLLSRMPDLADGPQSGARRQIDELLEVMRTNKGWNYMDPRAGTPSAVYARFAKWAAEGLMRRLVKALAELGLTKDWSQFLIAPLAKGETALKKIIGADAHAFATQPKKRASSKKRAVAKAKAHAASNEKAAKTKAQKAKTAKNKVGLTTADAKKSVKTAAKSAAGRKPKTSTKAKTAAAKTKSPKSLSAKKAAAKEVVENTAPTKASARKKATASTPKIAPTITGTSTKAPTNEKGTKAATKTVASSAKATASASRRAAGKAKASTSVVVASKAAKAKPAKTSPRR